MISFVHVHRSRRRTRRRKIYLKEFILLFYVLTSSLYIISVHLSHLESIEEETYHVELPVCKSRNNISTIATYCKKYLEENTCEQLAKRPISDSASKVKEKKCKTLWVSGLSVGYSQKIGKTRENQASDTNSGDGYQMQYASALLSFLENAKNALEPILILLSPENNTTPEFRIWVESMGVTVIQVHNISFEKLIYQHFPEYEFDGRIGYYLKLEIPQIIEQNGLFKKKDICNRHILYTDSDVLFIRQVQKKDLLNLKALLSEKKILLYGQDFLINRRKPSNTGVMLMDVPGFIQELPKIVSWARNMTNDFPEHDQLLINSYYGYKHKWYDENALLPPNWNWKVYWNLNNVYFENIFLVHFHGPKPGQDSGVDEMASCDIERIQYTPKPYQPFIQHAICCDKGRTAAAMLYMYRKWKSIVLKSNFSSHD